MAKLPNNQGDEYLRLWQEFEAGEAAEPRFARAIDRVLPLLLHLHSEGSTWQEHNISKEQAFSLNRRIDEGSSDLWLVIEKKLNEAVDNDILK